MRRIGGLHVSLLIDLFRGPYHQDMDLRSHLEKSAVGELPAKFMFFRGPDTGWEKVYKCICRKSYDRVACL
jgi:hypothetical protein